ERRGPLDDVGALEGLLRPGVDPGPARQVDAPPVGALLGHRRDQQVVAEEVLLRVAPDALVVVDLEAERAQERSAGRDGAAPLLGEVRHQPLAQAYTPSAQG